MGNLTPELAALRDETRDLAKSYGLDFYEVIFELVDHDELNMVASYGGFPVRYPHWRFGMEYEHLTKSYAYGLSKIYELVVNNDPCYAYLMRSNSITEQKLVMAHVYGHCDFFKNNAWFGHTSRKMMDVLANHGARIRRYMDRHGQERVENFIDVVHSLDNLIDPYSPYIDRGTEPKPTSHAEPESRREVKKIAAKDYMDRYINPPAFLLREREKMVAEETQARRFPAKPARDVLKFLLDHAPLETWEQDVLAMMRDEAYYFAPQGMTKVMNEGWAVFWGHSQDAERRPRRRRRVLVDRRGAGHQHRPLGWHPIVGDRGAPGEAVHALLALVVSPNGTVYGGVSFYPASQEVVFVWTPNWWNEVGGIPADVYAWRLYPIVFWCRGTLCAAAPMRHADCHLRVSLAGHWGRSPTRCCRWSPSLCPRLGVGTTGWPMRARSGWRGANRQLALRGPRSPRTALCGKPGSPLALWLTPQRPNRLQGGRSCRGCRRNSLSVASVVSHSRLAGTHPAGSATTSFPKESPMALHRMKEGREQGSSGLRALPFIVRAVAAVAIATVGNAQVLMPPNTNGRLGVWEQAIDHGPHNIGCAGTSNTIRFSPIHASLIPKGTYAGCVLLWEHGGQLECRFSNPVPHPFGADIDVRWAILDPRVSPPVIYQMAWRINVPDAPPPPCFPTNPTGHQGLFCGGHCWLPDGRLLVAGGDYWANSFCNTATTPPVTFAGSRIVLVFDPDLIDVSIPHQMVNGPAPGRPWASLTNPPAGPQPPVDLAVPRWYPTATLVAPANLSSSSNPFCYISVAGGIETFRETGPTIIHPGDPAYRTHELLRWNMNTGVITRDPRIGQTSGTAALFDGPATPMAAGLSFLYYPRTHFVSARTGSPDGRLWMGGMVAQASHADVINLPETWTDGDTLPLGPGNTLLEESTAVLFPAIGPGYRDWQIFIGGMRTSGSLGHIGTITGECWIMPTRNTLANWVGPVLPMNHARKFPNAVILPDASILVVGGGTNPVHGGTPGGQLEPEMFYNGGWIRLSNQATERTYHSIALLLPDGRVLSAGGDSCHDLAEYEIFRPPYLQFSFARPSFLQTPPLVMRYGQPYSFQVNIPFGQALDRVVLMRPASVTHGQDPGQRYEPLAVVPGNDTVNPVTTVLAPANPTIVPPGYCMLFLISAGVPSFAHWVQLLP